MNYTIKPTKAHGIFTLEDENGKPIADVRGKKNAEDFAALPELLDMIESQMLQIDIMASFLNSYADNLPKNNGIDQFLTLNNLRK